MDVITPLIISYELAAAKAKELKKMQFDMVVCDESHYLKSHKTKRSKAIAPLVKSIQWALLLSGTPALNRPVELYSQMHMLYPQIFKKFKTYAERYCDGHMSPMGYYDTSGMSNNFELKWIARKVCLIRRVKRDVLTELPKKYRSEIYLQLKKKKIKPMKRLFDRWHELNVNIPRMTPCSDEIKAAARTQDHHKWTVSQDIGSKGGCGSKSSEGLVDQGLKFIFLLQGTDGRGTRSVSFAYPYRWRHATQKRQANNVCTGLDQAICGCGR